MSSGSSSSANSPPPQKSGYLYNGAAATRSRRQNVDYGVRNLVTKLNSRDLHGLDVYRWEDDDLSLRSAAAQARLPYDRMTLRELQLFPEMAKSPPSVSLFLYIRNRTLVLWQHDPLVELTVETIHKELPEPFNSDFELLKGIHDYLQRYGYINFGVFLRLSQRQLDRPYRIVVVGAGTAGLAAARQLKFFGFEVLVLEARARPCGRVLTCRRREHPPADLGAMIITGIVGNPLVTLIQQTSCNVIRMSNKCPIYESCGKLVDHRKDDMIQKSFNNILTTIAYCVHEKGITEIQDDVKGEKKTKPRRISLGEAFQLILNQHELRVQIRRFKYWQKYKELADKLENINKRIKVCRSAIDECLERFRRDGISDLANATPEMFQIRTSMPDAEYDRRFAKRCLRKCLQLAVRQLDAAEMERRDIEHVIGDFKSMEPSYVFMNLLDKRILDFHLANLEYAIGAPLNSVALKDWDQDDPYGFAGSHMTIKEGLGTVIERLANDLDIQMNCVVEKIGYDEQGVSVTYSQSIKSESKPTTPDTPKGNVGKTKMNIKADAVLCTVPLGVLKKTPFLSVNDEPDGAILFEPPLPPWKREAIGRLGFGSLNKLVLFFEKPFWDTSKSSFGRLNDTPGSRGELFLFFSNNDLPFLIGLFAGEAASVTGLLDEKLVVRKAMDALIRIFGSNCPTEPIDWVVTKWHKDRFARGCYSYLSVGSAAEDYDILARPLKPNKKETALPRVFFAGEHTNKQYPSSVHGAFLSGLREAGSIADTFIGPLSPAGETISTVFQSTSVPGWNEEPCISASMDMPRPSTSGTSTINQQRPAIPKTRIQQQMGGAAKTNVQSALKRKAPMGDSRD